MTGARILVLIMGCPIRWRNDVRPSRLPALGVALCVALATDGAAQAASCQWEKLSRVALRTATGKAVFVAGMDIARTTEGLVIAGHPVYVWPIADTTVQDSLFGVLSTDSGVVSPIAAPHPGRRPLYPRVLALPGGIQAIWVERAESDRGFLPDAVAEGKLWYGEWVRGRWQNVVMIHAFRDALLAYYAGSRLRREDAALVFDYAMSKPLSGPGPAPGFVRLRRIDGRWATDTLPLTPTVVYARLAARGTDSVVAVVRSAEGPGHQESEMYVRRLAQAQPSWQRASVVSGGVSIPDLRALSATRWILAWRRFDGTLQARSASSSGDTLAFGPSRTLGTTSGFTLVPHGTTSAVIAWVAGEHLGALLVRPETMVAIPPLPIEAAILVPTLVPRGPTEYYLITTLLGTGGDEALATAYLTHLRLAC